MIDEKDNAKLMRCDKEHEIARECRSDESCFIETPSTDGLLYGGKVMCQCPKKTFCPIYFIGRKRIAYTDSRNRLTHYGITCKKRHY
ncbi:hypothetical protein ACTXT7_005314 [Hymenolepis weldensis]